MNKNKPIIAVLDDWGSVGSALRIQGARTIEPTTRKDVALAARHVDGIVLTGGGDVDPKLYSNHRHAQSYGIDKQRDELELFAIKLARANNIPLLGICRGHQLINVAFGGSLTQHLPDVTEKRHGSGSHRVHVRKHSGLAAMLSDLTFGVTSLHHQAVDHVGNGLVPVAWAADGTIEATQSMSDVKPFVLSVQFHPEMDHHTSPSNRTIFELFVSTCKNKSNRRRISEDDRWSAVDHLNLVTYTTYDYSTRKYKGEWWKRSDRGETSSYDDALAEDWLYGTDDDEMDYETWWRKNGMMDDRLVSGKVNTTDLEYCDEKCSFPPCRDPYSCIMDDDCFAAVVANTSTIAIEKYTDNVRQLKRGNGRKKVKNELR